MSARDAGYDDLLDALDAGDGYYLACPQGHGSFPPRHVCPHCGAADLVREQLPETGTVETYTVVHVAAPDFDADAPYATVVASFGPVSLTGTVADPDAVDVGSAVRPTVGRSLTTGDRVLAFVPADG